MLSACDRVFGLDDVHAPDARTGYSAVVLADQPAAYWRLGIASTMTAIDETGNGNTGMFLGGASPGAAGAIIGDNDTAVMFDGVDDCVSMGNRLSFEARALYSLEAWVKPTMNASYAGVISKAEENGAGTVRKGYKVFSDSSAVGSERSDGTFVQDARTGKLPLDAWSYVVVTYNGTDLTLYIDGVFQTTTPHQIAIPATSTAFAIGGRNGCAHSFFIGALDEVAVYDYALEPAQIENHRRVALGQ